MRGPLPSIQEESPMLENFTLPQLPPMEVLTACAFAALAASLLLAAALSPVLAVASEIVSIRTKRGFYNRTARQTAQMGRFLGVAAALLGGISVALLVRDEPAFLAPPYFFPLIEIGGAIALTLALLIAYVGMWPSKGLPGAGHLAIGMTAASFALFSLFCGTGLVRRLLHSPPDFDIALSPAMQLSLFFSIPADSFFWPLLAESAPLGLALAASFACVWLCILRDKQDYGRDYYAFALPYCAKWALLFTVLTLLAGAFVFLESRKIMLPELSREPSMLLDVASAVFPLLGCLLWLLVAKSEHPMRHKISVALAWIFLLTGLAGQMLMLNKVIPSP